MKWKCNCPLCRIIIHPIIRTIESKYGGSASYLTQKPATTPETELPEFPEEVKLMMQRPREETSGKKASEEQEELPIIPSAPQTPNTHTVQSNQASIAPKETELTPTQVKVEVPRELVERIDQLEEEIGKLRKELSTINESLKSVVLEFKEALAEASSPFNVLKAPKTVELNMKGVNDREKTGTLGSNPGYVGNSQLPPSKFIDLLILALNMLERMDRKQAISLIKGYIDTGVLERNAGEALIKIVELANYMKSQGISIEDQISFLYTLSKTFNIRDSKLEELVIKKLMRQNIHENT
ncbi:MAG TPA: hypothetical protein EYH40_01115 [Desulfurococcales archaeon]|nr:hypothetical protein [Desulfurococcales archaeon]